MFEKRWVVIYSKFYFASFRPTVWSSKGKRENNQPRASGFHPYLWQVGFSSNNSQHSHSLCTVAPAPTDGGNCFFFENLWLGGCGLVGSDVLWLLRLDHKGKSELPVSFGGLRRLAIWLVSNHRTGGGPSLPGKAEEGWHYTLWRKRILHPPLHPPLCSPSAGSWQYSLGRLQSEFPAEPLADSWPTEILKYNTIITPVIHCIF